MALTEQQKAEARLRIARARQSAQAQPDYNVIARTPDGGEIYETQSGTRGYKSEGYSTTNPEDVERLMQGATPIDIVQQDVDQQRINANPIASRALKSLEGVPFVGSYVDEAVGLFSPDASQNMSSSSQAMDRENPNESMALGLGGAIASAIPLAMAAGPAMLSKAAPTLGGRAVQALGAGAVAGGVEGAIYGYGEQDGGRVGNSQSNAIWGAGLGAVTGPLATYGAAGVRKLLTNLKGSDVEKISSELGISSSAATVIRNSLRSGGVDDAMTILQRGGDDAMLADVPAAGQLLDASAAAGGNAGRIARDAVQERTSAASQRLTGVLDETFGAPTDKTDIVDGVRASTAGQRSTAYDAAYASPIDYSSTQGTRLETLMRRVPAGAIRKAQQLMDVNDEASSQIMATIADNGRVTFQTMPDVRQTHYIMQALDDMAKGTDGTGTFGRQNAMGSGIERLRGQIGNTLKESVPEFAQAQSIAADTARQITMTDLGYDLLRPATRRGDVARSMRSASDAERSVAMQGVRSYIDDVTANVARTATDGDTAAREGVKVLRDMSSRSSREKLASLLGNDAADALLTEVDQAATAFELRAAIATNSKTAVRGAIQGTVRGQTQPGILGTIAQGEPVNATKRLVQSITGQTEEAIEIRNLGLFEEIASVLTETRGARAQGALRAINQAMDGQAITEAQASSIAQIMMTSAALAGSREGSRSTQ